jgi:hypothetical protein
VNKGQIIFAAVMLLLISQAMFLALGGTSLGFFDGT